MSMAGLLRTNSHSSFVVLTSSKLTRMLLEFVPNTAKGPISSAEKEYALAQCLITANGLVGDSDLLQDTQRQDVEKVS